MVHLWNYKIFISKCGNVTWTFVKKIQFVTFFKYCTFIFRIILSVNSGVIHSLQHFINGLTLPLQGLIYCLLLTDCPQKKSMWMKIAVIFIWYLKLSSIYIRILLKILLTKSFRKYFSWLCNLLYYFILRNNTQPVLHSMFKAIQDVNIPEYNYP